MYKKEKISNNKGFSLVELIIVIAIMAILAGALAPQLIQYIDQSRKGRDVESAQTIATAVNAALANDAAYSDATSCYLSECTTVTTNDFMKKIKEIIGAAVTNPTPKYKSGTYKDFYIEVSSTDKSFKIYAVITAAPAAAAPVATDQLYPMVGSNFMN